MPKQTASKQPINWIQACFTVFIILLPLVYSAKGVDPVLLPRQTVLCLVVMLLEGWMMFKLRTGIVFQSIIPLLAIGLGIVYALSTYQALNKVESYYIVLKINLFVAYLLVMYIGFKQNFITLKGVVLAVAISGLLATGLALREMFVLQTHGGDIFSDRNMYKVNGTFGHKNLLAAYLFLCWPMVIAQVFVQRKRIVKALFATGVVVIAALLLVLQTRAVLLAVSVCVVGAFVLLITGKNRTLMQRKIAGLVILLGLAGAIGAGYILKDKLSILTRTESFIERKNVWNNTLQMIEDHPVAGVGAANWQIQFPKYGMHKFYEVNYTISEGLTTFQRPHNDFLWVWAETGIVGLILYSLIFLTAITYAYRLYRNENEAHKQLIWGLILLQLIGFVMISLVDFPLERIEHPVLILTSLALVAATIPSSKIRFQLPRWCLVVLIALGLYTMMVSAQRWKSEVSLRKMYKMHQTQNWAGLITEGSRAHTQYLNMDYYSIPVDWYVGVGYFMQGNIPVAKQYFEKAYELTPYQVHVLNNYGACFEKEGNHARALELLEAAHALSPTFSDGVINLSGTYYNMGRYEDAYRMITTIGYDPKNPRLQTFVVAIIRKKIESLVAEEKDPVFVSYLKRLQTNDRDILASYQMAKEKHIEFMTLLKSEAGSP